MARRVVIEEECPIHGGFDPHWSSGQQNSNGPYRTCQMPSRVLDPGSYVRYMGEWDDWLPIYDQLPVVTRAALAHLYGRHDEPTAYCPLCGFFEDESVLDALARGDS